MMLATSPLAYEELTAPDGIITPPTICYPTSVAITAYTTTVAITPYTTSVQIGTCGD